MIYYTPHLSTKGYINLEGGKIVVGNLPLLFESDLDAYSFLVKNRGQLKHLGIPIDHLALMGTEHTSPLEIIEVDLIWNE